MSRRVTTPRTRNSRLGIGELVAGFGADRPKKLDAIVSRRLERFS